jgi:ABC-type Zn uptake system ZnuABC Zn-binding protein ZnuA
MKVFAATAMLLLLTGCTSFPVSGGGFAACVLCKVDIKATVPPVQSTAEKIGGGLAELLAQKLLKRSN